MTAPLRVAHVVCTSAFAGVERHVATLGAGLAERGCDVTVIGGHLDSMRPLLQPCGARSESAAGVGAAMAQLARHRPFDIVHAHMTQAELAAVVTRPLTRAPLVATRHFARTRGSTPSARVLGRVMSPRLAAQIAVSRCVAESIDEPCTVISPGVPGPTSTAAIDQRERVVLVAQRLEPEKQTDLALEAWRASGLAGRGWMLWLAGDGHERPALEALARSLSIESSCRFLGLRRDVEVLFEQASMLLAPCEVESFGLSVVEAMAAGLPVVAVAAGGHLETIGLVPDAAVYPRGDSAAAGRLLGQLANDPDRRATYARAELAVHRERFSVPRQVDETLALYRGLRP